MSSSFINATMSSEARSPRSVLAQVVLYIFLTLGPTLTHSEGIVYEKKIYGNWQVRQNQRYCRQVLYCKFHEANCTQVTTENTWACNKIKADINERGCVMRICKTDLKMVCSATSPGSEYQVTSSDSCPLGEQCYVKVIPETTTPVPVRTSPTTLTPGASTLSTTATIPPPSTGAPSVATTSAAQTGATTTNAPVSRTTTSVPAAATTLAPDENTAYVPVVTTASASEVTTAWASLGNTTLGSGATTGSASEVTTAALSENTTEAVPVTTNVDNSPFGARK